VEKELEKYLNQIENLEKSQTKLSEETPARKLNLSKILRYAAIFILFFGTGAIVSWLMVSHQYSQIVNNNLVHEVFAPKGSKSIAFLPDGTKVWLNAGTKISYTSTYGISDRNVTLEGEAYFKVKTNPKKPFTVITSELKIRAYGTAFNVKAYPDEKLITTTLEEGKIKIFGKGIDIALKPKQNISYERRVFTPEVTETTSISKRVDISQTEKGIQPHVATLSNINTKLYTSWKDDRWIIESEGLSNIAVLLERKFNVSVHVESEELLKYKFRGTFTNETLEQILNVFRFTAPIKYTIEKGIVTIDMDKNRKHAYMEITSQ
jgi:transmembrane sensor